MANKEMNFEQSLERLESIVGALEKGDTPLEESMKLFEEGTALVIRCNEMLKTAEQKVAVLKKGPDGQMEEIPFE